MTVRAVWDVAFSNGWFSRVALGVLVWFAYDYGEWAKAFASTSLTLPSKPDLLGVGATIAAVAGVPITILGLGLTKYMEMRAAQKAPDRRGAKP